MKLTHPDIQKEIDRLRAENPEATLMFFYSKEQDERSQWFRSLVGEECNSTIFKGKIYSECRIFEHGLESNFEDMELLGVGTYDDVTFGS